MRVIVRPMTINDIDQVLVLDELGFPSPWSRNTYRYEVNTNDRSTMLVLERADHPDSPNSNGAKGGWLSKILGKPEPPDPEKMPLIGYSGFWQIADEAHISTITAHPDWRGNKLGELLLWMMIRQAFRQQAQKVTLEVRVSNEIAQNLYRKYRFESIGRRRGYYRDNNEDAFIMMAEPLDADYRSMMRRYREAIEQKITVIDRVPHPESTD